MTWKVIKGLFWLAILGGIALLAYAYLGPVFFAEDFAAPVSQQSETVTLTPSGG